VGGQLLDVEERQPASGEDLPHGGEREVGVVLVVDGVELALIHQPRRWGNSHRQHAGRSKKEFQPRDEVVEVRQ